MNHRTERERVKRLAVPGVPATVRCATCRRELQDSTRMFCNECSRGYGARPGQGTPASPGRTTARRRRRRGR